MAAASLIIDTESAVTMIASASAEHAEIRIVAVAIPNIGGQAGETFLQHRALRVAGAARGGDGKADAAFGERDQLVAEHGEALLGQAIDGVVAADQHRDKRARQAGKDRSPAHNVGGELLRRHAMHRAEGAEHVVAGRRVVARRDDEVDLAAGEARVLHLDPEAPAAAGALDEPRRRDAVAAAGNDDVGPGWLQPAAGRIRCQAGGEPEAGWQVAPGCADNELLLGDRPAQRLG